MLAMTHFDSPFKYLTTPKVHSLLGTLWTPLPTIHNSIDNLKNMLRLILMLCSKWIYGHHYCSHLEIGLIFQTISMWGWYWAPYGLPLPHGFHVFFSWSLISQARNIACCPMLVQSCYLIIMLVSNPYYFHYLGIWNLSPYGVYSATNIRLVEFELVKIGMTFASWGAHALFIKSSLQMIGYH